MKIERVGSWPQGTSPELADGVPARFRRSFAPPVSAFGSVLTLWCDEREHTAGAVLGALRTASFDTQEIEWAGLSCPAPGTGDGMLCVVVKYRPVAEPSVILSASGGPPGAREWLDRAARSLAAILDTPYQKLEGRADA